jgi:vacuolar-type H+-ATPase subunit D/Vma8
MEKNKEKKEPKNKKDKILDEFEKLGKEISSLVKTAKDKYSKADPKAKQAVIAGIAGAAALIAGVIGYKKMKGKK